MQQLKIEKINKRSSYSLSPGTSDSWCTSGQPLKVLITTHAAAGLHITRLINQILYAIHEINHMRSSLILMSSSLHELVCPSVEQCKGSYAVSLVSEGINDALKGDRTLRPMMIGRFLRRN